MTKISLLKFSLSGMKFRGSKEATGDEKKNGYIFFFWVFSSSRNEEEEKIV